MENQPKECERKTVGEWLSGLFVWRIPVYQRRYKWKSKKDGSGPVDLFWETLKNQVTERMRGKTPDTHYFGAVLVNTHNAESRYATDFLYCDVVDGQQRLTTIQIAMLALIRGAEKHSRGREMRDALAKYMFADHSTVREVPRLRPTNFDREQFRRILNLEYGENRIEQGKKNENSEESTIAAVCDFFENDKSEGGVYNKIVRAWPGRESEVIDAIFKSLVKGFDFARIALREKDDPQQIFQSINSVAEPLTAFELIRNNVFWRAAKQERGLDEKLFESDAWKELEKPYWSATAHRGTSHIEAYVYRTMVAKMRRGRELGVDTNSVFRAYKDFVGNHSSIDEEINSLAEYTAIYQHLDSAGYPNPVAGVDWGIFRHVKWNNRDLYPVIFAIAYSSTDVSEKQRMIKLLEGYVIRRAVSGFPFGRYNQYAADLCKVLGDEPRYQSLRDILADAENSGAAFPDDEHVNTGCVALDFYKSDKIAPKQIQRYVFEEIEKFLQSETTPKLDLTIDHILPQAWEKNPEWRKIVLGDDADGREEITVNTRLHTIGNLALMSREKNSAKSNHTLEKVRERLKESGLKLNRDLAEEETWNVDKIEERSKKLAEIICKRWPRDIP